MIKWIILECLVSCQLPFGYLQAPRRKEAVHCYLHQKGGSECRQTSTVSVLVDVKDVAGRYPHLHVFRGRLSCKHGERTWSCTLESGIADVNMGIAFSILTAPAVAAKHYKDGTGDEQCGRDGS